MQSTLSGLSPDLQVAVRAVAGSQEALDALSRFLNCAHEPLKIMTEADYQSAQAAWALSLAFDAGQKARRRR